MLTAFIPWLINVILILGGLYLAYEGAEKIYEYFQKGIDTKPAENFFFDTFFSNIDLKLDENKFLEWFQEQIVVAEDALIMM